ncbi:MAG: 50S ribosomal protein L25 [Verrucomicrobiae bacterium]|nr:50S ribosomal protein L25 [Verrucomicrobiae bacterium]MCB1091402.1 50S ribosomal protein L25 [Verrucomicrobiae bacterium]
MSSHQTLKANKRETSGTTASKRLRREGIVPAVIYGSQQRTYAVQVDAKEFSELLRQQSSDNFLINLEIEGAQEKSKLVMVQAVEHNPLSGAVTHIDFHAVKEDETIHANIPIELQGTPAGAKEGGLVEHQIHSIEVFCRPADLPEKLEMDITSLGLGQSLHVRDLVLPKGVETHMDGDVVVVIVTEPRVAVAAEGTEASA